MFEELKKRRIKIGKSIEEISQLTKIKKSYIQAIEEGNLSELPIEVYTRSYIKIYSEILGIDPEKLIEEYEKYLKNVASSKEKNIFDLQVTNDLIEEKQNKSKNYPRWMFSIIITVIVFLIIFTILYFDRRQHAIPPPPEPQNLKSQFQGEVNQQKELMKEEPKKLNNLKIEATDKVWMRITIDDKEKKEYLLDKGQNISLDALKSFKLHIGNAGGVKVFFNSEDLGKLGETGQVVYLKLPKD